MSGRPIQGSFNNAGDLLAAAGDLRRASLEIFDAYSPFPVAGLDQVLGLRRSRLGLVCFAAGMAAAAAMLVFEIWVATVGWPLNIGGRPDNSLPAFIPAAFEIGVLCSALATAGVMLWRNRLFPGRPALDFGLSAGEEGFVLLVAPGDAAREILTRHHARLKEEEGGRGL